MDAGGSTIPSDARPRSEIAILPLHADAEDLIRTFGTDLARILTMQAKILAFHQGDDVVLRRHVNEAYEALTRDRQRTQLREFGIAIGGTLFGAFISGFMTELSTDDPIRSTWVAIYVIFGLAGLFMISWGLMSRQ